MLPAFKEKFPHYEVETMVRKGRHPYVRGDYSKSSRPLAFPTSHMRTLLGSQD